MPRKMRHLGFFLLICQSSTCCSFGEKKERKQMSEDRTSLLGTIGSVSYGADVETPLAAHRRTFSKHDSDLYAGSIKSAVSDTAPDRKRSEPIAPTQDTHINRKGGLPYYLIYAVVNVIISLPGLYGYAAVIFNNPIFSPYMNALSKVVIFSSSIHQLGFLLFSSLPFAIGTVQDAGLIFLSSMSNTIANRILKEGGTSDDVLSTTLVLLSLGTAMLGLVLVAMGHFKLADAVSYLPMPVVGGYLAFIGYFCLTAGVGLCISESMMIPADWAYLLEPHNLILAIPGLLSGLFMTMVSRNIESDAALPLLMVFIPSVFYIVIFSTGIGLDGAREGGWVGDVAPPVPVGDLFHLIDFKRVRWDLIFDILPTWSGMIFVVSFASCLDVAAISLDMGEALDTNRELSTVGICNFMSGALCGMTGSYIFSQTIFTYRTGVHSKWIGFFIMLVFWYVVTSPINVLQMAPLFFFGATLIFIGYDLLYEWLIEIRHKVFLSEYCIVWATFIAIQVVGIDFGIVVGVLVAIVSHVVSTAQISSVNRVSISSRAVWTPSDYKLLHDHGYNPLHPKIVTLEITGTVFFGSSLKLLERISEEIGLNLSEEELVDNVLLKSPHRSSYNVSMDMERRMSFTPKATRTILRRPPKLLVLDLTQVPNVDASASRGCFLQLAKMCAKRDMIVCAAGANPHVEWMLRSHDVSYDEEEEARIEAHLQSRTTSARQEKTKCDRVLLFLTIHEALEFCENVLIHDLKADKPTKRPSFIKLDQYGDESEKFISTIITHILGLEAEERIAVKILDYERYHSEMHLRAGALVFDKDTHPSSFYIVLKGSVAVASTEAPKKKGVSIVSGAGPVSPSYGRKWLDPNIEMLQGSLSSIWPVGGIFGYVDYMLDRPRTFRAVSAQHGTIVAKFTRSQMLLLRSEDTTLDGIMQRLLLQASVMDLANCTCRN